MIEWIVSRDKELFLYLNDMHTEVLDPVMLILSSYTAWTVVFVFFGLAIFIYQQQYKIASIVFYALSVLVSTTLTNILKLIVKRPRPIHEEEWVGTIHNIEEFSSAYSFFSSHAATTFCIATFVFLIFKTKKHIGYIAYSWALAVSYSRIYVAKHYPVDVLVGLVFGVLTGIIGFTLLQRYIAHNSESLSEGKS